MLWFCDVLRVKNYEAKNKCAMYKIVHILYLKLYLKVNL